MKQLTVILVLCAQFGFSQIDFPEWSIETKVQYKIGYTNFELRYGRPSARERKIMGQVVPYDRLWRTGAGKGTTIAFDKPVVIQGKALAAGTYAFVTIPGENEWTILINTDTSKIYGDPSEYDLATEVLRFNIKSEKTCRFYETFTIGLDHKFGDALFFMAWENTQLSFTIETGAHRQVMAAIDAELSKKPSDHEAHYMAAWYYYMNNQDPVQALKWIDHSLAIHHSWWVFDLKIDLLERMKKFEDARKTIREGIEYLTKHKPDGDWQQGVKQYEKRLAALRQ